MNVEFYQIISCIIYFLFKPLVIYVNIKGKCRSALKAGYSCYERFIDQFVYVIGISKDTLYSSLNMFFLYFFYT